MTTNDIMDVYQSRPFYSTTEFGRTDVNLPKHQNVGEVVMRHQK